MSNTRHEQDQKKQSVNPKHLTLIILPLLVILIAAFAAYQYKAGPEAGAVPAAQPDLLPKLAEPKLETIEGVVKSGDTAQSLLAPYLSTTEISDLAAETRKVFSPRDIKAGQPYRLTLRAGELTSFEYSINTEEKLVIHKNNDDYSAERRQLPSEVRVTRIDGRIDSTLFDAVAASGEKPELAIKIADIFAWDIDFCRDIQPGDSFHAVIEKRYVNGKFTSYGRILAADFTNDGESYQGFLFRYKNHDGYYDAKGNALRKAFLRAPLSFTRISSGFTFKRLHPVLNYYRPHLGIDYAAPTGTPVWTVADGAITRTGYNREAGNFIRIRHPGGYETQYNHLSAIAKSIRSGKPVTQGQTIGYVGSTGLATGPHLDFRMYQNGQPLNALKLKTRQAEPLAGPALAQFHTAAKQLASLLNGEPKVAGL